MNGIDPRFFKADTRFGPGFYVANQAKTAVAEVTNKLSKATHSIRYRFNSSAAKTLDLTDPSIAKAWNYTGGPITAATRNIGKKARDAGYNVINFKSLRGAGDNKVILDNFKNILTPQMISPVP